MFSVAFSPNGDRLAATFFSTVIRIWRWPTREDDCTLDGHNHYVSAVAFLRDGRTLVSSGTDRLVKIWDLESKQERFSLRGGSRVSEVWPFHRMRKPSLRAPATELFACFAQQPRRK